jgi:hypothetical protein
MGILDPALIAEIAGITTAILQSIKSHPKVRGSSIPYLGGFVGVAVGFVWYVVSGDLLSEGGIWGIDWQNSYRGILNGVAGSVVAQGGYNLQKALPIPNLLPSANEMDEKAIQEEVTKQTLVVDAAQSGVDPKKAKEAVGLTHEEPPPVAELKEIQPTPTEMAVILENPSVGTQG